MYIYIYIYIYKCTLCIQLRHIDNNTKVPPHAPGEAMSSTPVTGHSGRRTYIVAIFYPFSQFCEINVSLSSL